MINIAFRCFYFPTTVLLIDDNMPFMENLSLLLETDGQVKLIENPEKALSEIQSDSQTELFKKSFFCKSFEDTEESEKIDEKGHPTINIDIETLHHEIYNPHRFSHISVAVVDYNMPHMNGIELCRKLQNAPLTKILLTGEADDNIAVSAFNEGIIDKFVRKGSKTMVEEVNHAVQNAQIKFFEKISIPLITALSSDTHFILNTPSFKKIFEKLYKSKHIIEYYLIEKLGSYLMLDANAKPYFLIIKSEDEINQFYDIAVWNRADASIKEALKLKYKMPVFLTELEHRLPVNQWQKYLYDSLPLETDSQYYYSIIEDNQSNYIDLDKVASYRNQKFLRK